MRTPSCRYSRLLTSVILLCQMHKKLCYFKKHGNIFLDILNKVLLFVRDGRHLWRQSCLLFAATYFEEERYCGLLEKVKTFAVDLWDSCRFDPDVAHALTVLGILRFKLLVINKHPSLVDALEPCSRRILEYPNGPTYNEVLDVFASHVMVKRAYSDLPFAF